MYAFLAFAAIGQTGARKLAEAMHALFAAVAVVSVRAVTNSAANAVHACAVIAIRLGLTRSRPANTIGAYIVHGAIRSLGARPRAVEAFEDRIVRGALTRHASPAGIIASDTRTVAPVVDQTPCSWNERRNTVSVLAMVACAGEPVVCARMGRRSGRPVYWVGLWIAHQANVIIRGIALHDRCLVNFACTLLGMLTHAFVAANIKRGRIAIADAVLAFANPILVLVL